MPIEFKHQRLSNGLDVVAECNDDAHTAAVGFFVRTGARDETPEVMGVSHFLEHMMFKGTDRRTADDVNREFDEMGANYNAFTSHEATVYYAHVLPEFLPRSVDLIGDMLRPALRDDDFTMEKNVILEEIGMYEDRPQWRLQDALIEHHFADHPLGFRVLGTKQTIQDLAAEQMREYFRRRYGSDSVTVAAAGRIDFEKFVADLEAITKDWRETGGGRSTETPTPQVGEFRETDAKLKRHYFAMLSPAPAQQDERRYAATILADVIGDTEGSRLYWALVDPGLADEADLSYMGLDHAGAFLGYASCAPERRIEVEQKFLETIDDAVADLGEDELERPKNKIATQVTLQGESPRGRMTALGGRWMVLGEYVPLDEQIERIMAVTLGDVREIAREFPFTTRTICTLGPR